MSQSPDAGAVCLDPSCPLGLRPVLQEPGSLICLLNQDILNPGCITALCSVLLEREFEHGSSQVFACDPRKENKLT